LFHRQRKRKEKRAAFDREPPIAANRRFPKRLAGRGRFYASPIAWLDLL
jgi:hypothetical protein